MRRRIWVIVFVTLAVFAVVYLWSGSLVPQYRTSISVEVTKAVATEGMERWLYYKGHPIETAMKQIQSRACIEAALRDIGEITDTMSEAAVQEQVSRLLRMTSVSNVPNTNIVTISVLGEEQNKLATYANAIALAYQRLEREWDQRNDDEVIRFLEERIAQYKERLENAEARMVAFRSTSIALGVTEDLSSQMKLRTDLALRAAVVADQVAEIRSGRGAWNPDQDPELSALLRQREDLVVRREAVLSRYTELHPDAVRYADEIARLDKQIAARRVEIQEAYRAQVAAALSAKERELASIRQQQSQIETLLANLPQDQVTRANLEMELDLSRKLYSMFWERLEQQKIVRQSKSGGVNLQGPATTPWKVYPDEQAHNMMGIALGLLLGFAFAFLLETLDTSIRTIEEIEEFVGVKVLGVVPLILIDPGDAPPAGDLVPGTPSPRDPGSIVFHHPRDPASEGYRTIASTLEFNFFNEGHRVLLLASATPQEGKTTSVCNLGIALALSGRRVLAIDCNLRHPGVTKVFSLSGHAGTAEVLAGTVPWKICVYPTSVPNLDVMPTGTLPGQPVELIKQGMPRLLRDVSIVYDAVLIDSPPLLPVADAAILSSMAGGTLLVYSQGRAPRDVLSRARSKIENARGRVIGTCLNKVKPEGELGKNYYYYYYSYYPAGAKGGRGKGRKQA